MDLLRMAVSQNFDIDKLEKLMALQREWEANEARKAFVAAMNAFKQNPPEIIKNKHVKFGQTEYDHATLDAVCRAVIEGLSQHGISHRWRPEQGDGWVKITCILMHDLGHCEETSLIGPPDNSGSKNAIQAISSTVTYLERYTLLAATGLAAANTDTDGRAPHVNKNGNNAQTVSVASDWLQERCEWLASASTPIELDKLFKAAYAEASKANDRNAQECLIKAKDRRKREL
jgi:hypothetical protein